MPPQTPLMLGVVHRDPDGEQRLSAALDRLRPTWVTLEISPYAVAFRRARGAQLLARLEELTPSGKADHGEIQAIRETLLVPFEVRAVESYAKKHDCRVDLVDDSDLSRRLLADVEAELLTADNLRNLTQRSDVPLARTVDSFYRRTRRLLADEPVAPVLLGFPVERLALLQVRDERMAAVIRDVRADMDGASWLHVGGVFHLLRVRGLKLLWEQFADEGVSRAFLDEDFS